MPVRVVTDSASDLTDDLARELGVSVVPLTIRFGFMILGCRRCLRLNISSCLVSPLARTAAS